MKPLVAFVCVLVGASHPVYAQGQRIKVGLEARSEGQATSDRNAARLLADVRLGLQAIGDVDLVPQKDSRRMIWIVAGMGPGPYAASVMVTERYDRETLMVLGIEDDDTAERMMSLQIVNDHQIFTGSDLAEVARHIVESVNTGALARLRTRAPKP